MRRMLANALVELADKDENLFFLTGDLGFQVFDDFQMKHPNRYLNVGIAEAALVSIAAGLAATGFKPIIYSIASFMTARPYEQIKIMAGYNKFPIIIIGAGGGISYGKSGATHHATDDIGLMSLIPNLRVAAPAGPYELKEIIVDSYDYHGSTYIQIGKFDEKDLNSKEVINKNENLILSTGVVSSEVEKIHSELIKRGKKIDFLHLSFVSDLHKIFEVKEFSSYKNIFVVEDHILNCGMFSQVAQLFAQITHNTRITRFGLPNIFIEEFLTTSEIREKYGYSPEQIIRSIEKAID